LLSLPFPANPYLLKVKPSPEAILLSGLFLKEFLMKTYDHLLSSHLEAFPRAYAKSAKQKTVHQQSHNTHWAALKTSLQTAWAHWVEQSRCDRLSQDKRQRSRACLAN
jgi:hypothetical protein